MSHVMSNNTKNKKEGFWANMTLELSKAEDNYGRFRWNQLLFLISKEIYFCMKIDDVIVGHSQTMVNDTMCDNFVRNVRE